MAPVYEHLHNKRLRKQNGTSLLTLKCLPSILKKIDEQFFPYLYVRCGISSKNTLQKIVNNSHSHRETSNSFCLSNSCYRKPRFRAHAAIFGIGATLVREITARGVVWGGKIAASYSIFSFFDLFNFFLLVVLATAIVSSTLLRCWTIIPYCCFQLCNWFMILTESTLQSTFLEYFCAISTIEKYFY